MERNFCFYIAVIYVKPYLQVHAFVAPKVIDGKNTPSPVRELGTGEITQALELIDVCYEQV